MDDLSDFFNDLFTNTDGSELSKIESQEDLVSYIKERDLYDFSSIDDKEILVGLNNFLNSGEDMNLEVQDKLNPDKNDGISFGGGLGICNIKCLNDENAWVSATNRDDY